MIGVLMAFNNYQLRLGMSGIFSSPWVGLDHFKRLFANPYIYQVLFNTIWLALLKLIFCFPAPIVFALLLNELNNVYFKRIIQTITYLPNFISAVVIMGLVQSLLSPTYGTLNSVRELLGLERIHFLAEADYFRSILVGIDLWKWFGWGAIVYLAAITTIDVEQYEAAYLDGAGRIRRMWHITLPGIKSIIALYLILDVGNILNVGFEMIFLLQSPTVLRVADTIDLYTYRMGIEQINYSFGTAVGLFKSVIGLILITGANYIAKKLDTPGVW
jgi:putative aldouronate transport system permease protein